MPKKKYEHLIWVDLEMTGLNPRVHKILEISTIITDKYLKILDIGPNIIIFQKQKELKKMSSSVLGIHTRSKLINNIQNSHDDEASAEKKTLVFLKKWIPKNCSPMCGNTISTDRNFLIKYMPKLEKYFHYRNIDVSSIHELAKRWFSNTMQHVRKKKEHRSQQDLIESIEELKFYKKTIFSL
ncbi:oligoribonuclease [Buchnera aphidicola]|uniref:oligoribonuclease n=1 Tax=Buchnera aphidicola TaxID=9 RepID=UPI00094CBFF4|nr:oligoribonuclease [Buchnera aphidicola]